MEWRISCTYHPCHLNSPTEGNLSISLTEMKITDTEFGARNVDREIDFATSTQILDVTVAAVLGPAFRRRVSNFAIVHNNL